MLEFDIEEKLLADWQRTIEKYFALNLGGMTFEFKSMVLKIREIGEGKFQSSAFRCEAAITPNYGEELLVSTERENCDDAIKECLAKVRRTLRRKMKEQARYTA